MIEINDHDDEKTQQLKEKLSNSTPEQAKAAAHIYLTKKVTESVIFIVLLVISVVMAYFTKSPKWVLLMFLYLIF